MTTLARPVGGTPPKPADLDEFAAIARVENPSRSSQVSLSRETVAAALWSVAPAALAGAIEGIAHRRTILPILILAAHQLAILLISRQDDHKRNTWGILEWAMLMAGAITTVAIVAPQLLPWLAIPIAPALLLRAAQKERPLPRATPLLRMFSIATLGAVLIQLPPGWSSAGEAVAILGASLLFLISLECLTSSKRT